MKLKVAMGMVLMSMVASSAQAAPNLEGGSWLCKRADTPEGVDEWTRYQFNGNGTIASQEWMQNKENSKVVLEFTLSVDYSYFDNGEELVLKPTKLTRDISVDQFNVDPFNYDTRRDLLGYRIFFQPQFENDNRAQFEMRHHITPEHPFTLSCQRQA
ncbi:hypothetical protein C9I98_07685 [Photobacterium sanctipauli]|uniref:Uncharacterized protein n=1 Tax=Photobacterium sanctipauli TaxID=1342794 RepID=A0A2T3NWS2_9GAMM|nr:hypothetical protein [Photobacterium sanctipauli]PSW20715.1 hypothetical protein C9I98_07685 [Photobacterium sanctipauli]